MCWQVFAGLLTSPISRRYRLIAFDLPGHGASENAREPERTYNIPGYGDLAIEILEALKIDEAAILGWSLGGHVGFEVMGRWTGLRGLMAVGTPPVSPGPDVLTEAFIETPLMAFAGEPNATHGEAEAYARACCGASVEGMPFLLESARRTDGRARHGMMSAALAGRGVDGRRIAETSSVPLAIIVGADDPFINKLFLHSLDYAHLWRSTIHIMENCGHAPFLDRPVSFNSLFESFLSEILPSPESCP